MGQDYSEVEVEIEQLRPYLTDSGELIIPTDVPEKYKWWAGGQSVAKTLEELEAPKEVVDRYIDQKKGLKS